jgi:hypothetical protein
MKAKFYSFACCVTRPDIRIGRGAIEIRKPSWAEEIEMTWRKEIDYHASRSYDADGPKARLWTAIIGWLADRAGRKAKPVMRKKSSAGLPPGAHRGFSLLGAHSPAPKHDPVGSPYPLKPSDSPFRPDWRVLP